MEEPMTMAVKSPATASSASATAIVLAVCTTDNVVIGLSRADLAGMKMLAELAETLGDSTRAIPLPNASSAEVLEISRWIRERNSPERAQDGLDDPRGVYWQLISSDVAGLVSLCLAANYLECTGYREMCTKVIAILLTGKSPAQLREMLGLPDDLNPAYVAEQAARRLAEETKEMAVGEPPATPKARLTDSVFKGRTKKSRTNK